MCCLLATLAFFGPRAAILVWWLIDMARWEAAFSNFWIAFVGFIFAPWTTLAWALVAHNGVRGFDWIWLGLGVLADIASWSSQGWTGRQRYATAT